MPDTSLIAILRDSLHAKMKRCRSSVELMTYPTQKLKRYAHEIAFEAEGVEVPAAGQSNQIQIDCWVARESDRNGESRSRRYYLIAEVILDTASEWFPVLLKSAARLRSHLNPDEQADVMVLIITEPGAEAEGIVSVLERNEAFAQVFVWNPGKDQQQWSTEADHFTARLWLGPIQRLVGEAKGDLSPVDSIFDGISAGSDVRSRWLRILNHAELGNVERARRLLLAVEEAAGETHDQ
jgi:hypothetical protein